MTSDKSILGRDIDAGYRDYTIVFAAITIYLCYDEYKKGKMSLRNFKIVSICESLAILGMIFLIIC